MNLLASTGTAITGSASHAPPDVVSNEDLCAAFNVWVRWENDRREAKLAESTPAFIERASGIRRRHYWDAAGILDPKRLAPRIPDRPDHELSVQAELGLAAAQKAVAAAGVEGRDVDLVVLGASALQRPYPALAIEVQKGLGARGFAFDISVGCGSSTFAVQLAVDAIRNGTAGCALVCVPELPSAYCNFRDRDTHFILGDAAAAVVVQRLSDARAGFEVLHSQATTTFSNAVRNNGGFLNRADEARRDAGDKLFYQDGRRVFRDIVGLLPPFLLAQLDELGLKPAAVARYWLHQANARLNAAILERVLGRAADERDAPSVLSEYGNTAAAGCLLSFAQHHEDLRAGELGVLCAFGAGYTAGSQVLRRL